MDNRKGNASYPPNQRNLGQDYESSQQPKLHARSLSNPQDDVFADDVHNEDYVYDTESSEEDENMEEIGTVGQTKEIVISDAVGNDYDVDDEDEDEEEEDEEDARKIQDDGLNREERKKRKLEALLSRYEFAPRAVVTPPVPKPRAGRNAHTDWTEEESFALLEGWGERYLKHGRKNVRSDEWHEVSQKVSEVSKFKRTETQCRNRLDTLKKKYKKEKAMLAEKVDASSKWLYFSKMDMILCPPSNPENEYASVEPNFLPNHDSNPANGYVSVEPDVLPTLASNPADVYVSVEPKANSNHANSSDEMKDGLVGDSEFAANDVSDNVEDLPSKKARKRRARGMGDCCKLIADSINNLASTIEKVQNSKNKVLVDLEKQRMDSWANLELEKSKIMKKAHVEIAKLWGLTSKDLDASPDNVSG